jgi:arylsulfatase A-like enzyme
MPLLCFWLALAGFLTGSVASQTPNPNAAKGRPTQPSLVFIVADDLSPTLGCYGDSVAPTPTIDRLAREGVLFENAFCMAPSCSPSRASMLTSRYPHQLAEGTNLWGTLPSRFPNYVKLLETAGYRVGLFGKGWGPGNHEVGGYDRNPAGPGFKSFQEFMDGQQPDAPFCFWVGTQDPHRPYDPALKQAMRLHPERLKVPAQLPDTPELRADLLDYYAEVARVERTVAEVVTLLERTGRLENTLVVVTGDNGMPFPRAKANLYDAGSRVPLVVRGGRFRGGKRIAAPVGLIDLAPTFLEWAGLPKAEGMEGRSLARFTEKKAPAPAPVFLERERHAQVRAGNLGYPARAIRTADFLFIENLKPDRWPAGDPNVVFSVGDYGDIDGGPGKTFLLDHRAEFPALFDAATAKRPAEELYDLRTDSDQLRNLVANPAHRKIRDALHRQLQAWRKQTADPRLTPAGDAIDTYPYYGNKASKKTE